jgi:anti-sigma factor RsiW
MSQEPANGATPPEVPPDDEQLVAYLDGELEPDESRQVELRLASDPGVRRKLQGLQRSWELLDELHPADVEEAFTRTTMEMVTVAAAEEVAQIQAAEPRRRRRRWLVGIGGLLAAAIAGFAVGWLAWPDRERALLEDLPVIERLDEYRLIGDFRFLKKLAAERLFDEDRERRP